MKVKTDQIPKIYVPTQRYQKKKNYLKNECQRNTEERV